MCIKAVGSLVRQSLVLSHQVLQKPNPTPQPSIRKRPKLKPPTPPLGRHVLHQRLLRHPRPRGPDVQAYACRVPAPATTPGAGGERTEDRSRLAGVRRYARAFLVHTVFASDKWPTEKTGFVAKLGKKLGVRESRTSVADKLERERRVEQALKESGLLA